jgi:mono/diheme cytochrome c family protein
LPNASEKALVLKYCKDCHGIDWIVRSGGTVDGWTSRIQRMIRGGAMIPKEQIPSVAAYLAKALPPRAPPPDPP